ncbi:hypothetical protein EHQ46_07700 [Leptospira yanagawae]|uniref:Galactose oxidase n=1 Tax=Leptospira yanagawae TaxID=293069 RepID=A0ABY2M4Z7_9LEPT|nr:delta-60 repeat domain-containing protein [Leptospira yanagawae]TGL21728.1 hypothetical protein EHQ46_07700 [Leptospira yanagawae]
MKIQDRSFCILISLYLFSFCAPIKLSNSCDPSSESYVRAVLFRFLIKDDSPSCWPGFAKDNDLWGVHSPNFSINSALVEPTRVLLGGDFNYVGPNVGNVAVLQTDSGLLHEKTSCPYLEVSGNANVSISDGAGGFYIGGSFVSMRGETKNKIAHILPNCKLDPNFNAPSPTIVSHYIEAMELDGGYLYIGGNFTNLDGVARTGIARLNAQTGSLDSTWNPSIAGGSQSVFVLRKSGDHLYVGGRYTIINGFTRNSLARFSLSTGVLDNLWAASTVVNDAIRDLAFGRLTTGTDVVLAVGDVSIPQLYAFQQSNGAVPVGWNVTFSGGNAYTVKFHQDKIIIGGGFTHVNGVSTGRLAVLNNTNGAIVSGFVNINANNEIDSSIIINNQLIFFGQFTSVSGLERNYAAAINLDNYSLTDFNPNFTHVGSVDNNKASLISDNRLVVPGSFTSANGVRRQHLAEISRITGKVTDWNPKVDLAVLKIKSFGTKIYITGAFSSYNDEPKTQGVVSLNQNDLSLTSDRFDLTTNPYVEDVCVGESKVFMGGSFDNAQGIAKYNMAAFDKSTGIIDSSWSATVTSGSVSSILEKDGFLYVGGGFTAIGGVSSNNLHRINASNGQSSGLFYSNLPDNAVSAQAIWNNQLYFVGSFINYGPYFASYDISSPNSVITSFAFTGSVNQLLILENGKSFVRGSFSSVSGFARNQFAVLDLVEKTVTSFDLTRNGNVNGFSSSGNEVILFGAFSRLNKRVRGGFEIFPTSIF